MSEKSNLPDHAIEYILARETNPARFEKFCAELFSLEDQLHYVPTSASYDQGRDARARGTGDKSSAVICCSLDADPESKATRDATSLFKHAHPTHVRFCSSIRVSEYKLDAIQQSFQSSATGPCTIHADGLLQITRFASYHPEVVDKYYHGELQELARLLSHAQGEDASLVGLRIAITTQMSPDAADLRNEAYAILVEQLLADRPGQTASDLCSLLAQALHLSTPIPEAAVRQVLSGMETDGTAEVRFSRWTLTTSGTSKAAGHAQVALEHLAHGEQLVRSQLESLCGDRIPPDVFQSVWRRLLHGLGEVFYTNGIAIAEATSAVLLGEHADDRVEAESSIITAIGSLAASSTAAVEDMTFKRALTQAIIDVFAFRTGPGFDWLAGLAEVYVVLCSFGLESRAQSELKQRLRHRDLIIDSDVALSALCTGEPDHPALVGAIKAWHDIGGRVYVCDSVLEEVAYHAWISETDYNDIEPDLAKYTDSDAHHLVDNAFVRTFLLTSPRKRARKAWMSYIMNFRGTTQTDVRSVKAALHALGVENLTGFTHAKGIVESVAKLVLVKKRQVPGIESKKHSDLSRRDGLLAADSIEHARRMGKADSSVVLVSGSGILRLIVSRVARDDNVKLIACSPSVLCHLVSLMPGARLTESSLRAVLVDSQLTSRLLPMERRALRVIRGSSQYDLAFAKRHLLCTELDLGINKLAVELGMKRKRVAEELMDQTELAKEHFPRVLRDALDKLVESASERRLRELEEKQRPRGRKT